MAKSLSISTRKEGQEERKVIRPISADEFAKMYKLKEEVQESTHAGMEVLFANRRADGVEVVVKKRVKQLSFKSAAEERDWRATTEVQLNMPKTESMCEFYEVLETREHYFVVMEKVEGKDLFEQMAEEYINSVDAREIVRQILFALRSMHQAGRIHKDLKLENVVVDMDSPNKKSQMASASYSPGGRRNSNSSATVLLLNSLNITSTCSPSFSSASPAGAEGCPSPVEAKLIDFDTVENWEPSSPKSKDVLGTDGYIAPEAYDGEYSPASDIYCVGVIMYKLLTRRFPSDPAIFDDKPGENWVGHPSMKRIKERLRQEKINFARPPLDRCPAAADIIRSMLTFNPGDRPSAEQALEHEWFRLSPRLLGEVPEKRRSTAGR